MKIKHLKRYLIGIAMTAFLALFAGNAFGDGAATTNATVDFGDGTTTDLGRWANNYMVMSPYWQVEGGGLIPSSRFPTRRFRVWLHKSVLRSTLSLAPVPRTTLLKSSPLLPGIPSECLLFRRITLLLIQRLSPRRYF